MDNEMTEAELVEIERTRMPTIEAANIARRLTNEVRRLQVREKELISALRKALRAMRVWGDIEDCIPRHDESGTPIRAVYRRAKALLKSMETT